MVDDWGKCSEQVLITGIGVVAPNGIGRVSFWDNCSQRVTGIKQITLFDVETRGSRLAGEIGEFDPAAFLGAKGLRNMDRTTLLALVGSKLALEDAGLRISREDAGDYGVVLGSTMGSVRSISRFDIDSLLNGPHFVNPALFPNTVINSPASQLSIRFGLKGLNSTIATGFTASLDALDYAADMLRLGRLHGALAGGVEELSEETYRGFRELHLLKSSNGSTHLDAQLCSTEETYLGEGCAMFVLESEQVAKVRNVAPLALLKAIRRGFVDTSCGTGTHAVLNRLVLGVLDEARVGVGDVKHVLACNVQCEAGTPEMSVLGKVFGDRLGRILLSDLRPLIGECFSAMGALQLAGAIGLVRKVGGGNLLIVHASRIGTCCVAMLTVVAE